MPTDTEEQTADAAAPAKASKAAKSCPDCKGELVQHGPDNPFKADCWHCLGCGTCWQPDLKAPR